MFPISDTFLLRMGNSHPNTGSNQIVSDDYLDSIDRLKRLMLRMAEIEVGRWQVDAFFHLNSLLKNEMNESGNQQ
ncbi:hypothetical protein HB976_06270 [Yersinia mollaretii]|nr:hypothetical protein [Yersinia mollaretii]MDA5534639.1 hypothetical protein [Yersinia mollaretii]NIL02559.1 hypothetical protein [Yersinia mollaretii]